MTGAFTLLLSVGFTSAMAQTPGQPASPPAPPRAVAPAMPASAAAPVSLAERALLGTWYGELAAPGSSGGPSQRYLTTRLPDGTYRLELRTYENGKPTTKLTNSGLWGISNGLFFTIATEVNGKRTPIREPGYTSAYLVRGVSGNEFNYQHIASGLELRVVRAAPDTVLPD